MNAPRGIDRLRFLRMLGSGAIALGAAGGTFGTGLRRVGAAPARTGYPIVETTAGPVRGYRQNGTSIFKGVPYAASPVGILRFRPPRPPQPWTVVRDATLFGPAVPQVVPAGFPIPVSEDGCLTVNVWTPSTASHRRRPVLVWALDGAHMAGYPQMVDGRQLAETYDVVVVSISVRVGTLGYLWLGDALGGRFDTSGNLGSLDHALALRWVRANIDRFGGDPLNVTAFGISGAAGSTLALMAMPSARGLFHRATVQSGDQTSYRSFREAGLTTDAVFAALGLGSSDREQILELSLASILQAEARVLATPRPLDQSTWYGPVVGTVLPQHPIDALRHGASADVEIIAGNVRDEFTFQIAQAAGVAILGESQVRPIFEATFPGEGDSAVAAYQDYHGETRWPYLLAALFGDRQFGFGGIRVAKARYEVGAPTWIYRFEWDSPAAQPLGARHGVDWAFTLDNLAEGGGPVPLGPNPPQALADAMSGAVTRFATSGSPGHGWTPYDPRHGTAMIFNTVSRVDTHNPLGDLQRFWERSRSGIDLDAPWIWPSV
jgi:para-nitrobenzyl esterase